MIGNTLRRWRPAFVGRRVESDPVILLAAIPDGYDSPLLRAGLPELHVLGLAGLPASC